MPSDVMPDVTPHRVTPAAGKGALGTWRARAWPRTLCRGRSAIYELEPGAQTAIERGAYVPAFKPPRCREGGGRTARVRTGLGKSDRPGS